MRRVDNLTTFMADCLEIWEPQPPGTLRACNRRLEGLLYLYLYVYYFIAHEKEPGTQVLRLWLSMQNFCLSVLLDSTPILSCIVL